jgi:hypothetical protein
VSAEALKTYGWELRRGIWHQTKPHLTVVPEPEPVTAYRPRVCQCGGPKSRRARTCHTCRYADVTRVERERSPEWIAADISALEEVLDRWIRGTTIPVLAVRTCDDCGCLLHVDDTDCFVCVMRADRSETALWRVTG